MSNEANTYGVKNEDIIVTIQMDLPTVNILLGLIAEKSIKDYYNLYKAIRDSGEQATLQTLAEAKKRYEEADEDSDEASNNIVQLPGKAAGVPKELPFKLEDSAGPTSDIPTRTKPTARKSRDKRKK